MFYLVKKELDSAVRSTKGPNIIRFDIRTESIECKLYKILVPDIPEPALVLSVANLSGVSVTA